jgi:prepilin-type N-terminal cleavage/methylation domain-containing protein
MNNKSNLRGFSLIELLIYMAIFTIISFIVWQGIQWMQQKDLDITAQQKIYAEADNAIQVIKKDIENFDSQLDGEISTDSNFRCLKIKNKGYLFIEDSKTRLFSLNQVSIDCLATNPKKLSSSIFQLDIGIHAFDVSPTPANNSKNFLVKFKFKIASILNKPYSVNFYQTRTPLTF